MFFPQRRSERPRHEDDMEENINDSSDDDVDDDEDNLSMDDSDPSNDAGARCVQC